MIVSRLEKIYQEIEAFADYELTQCIAYEMAIRNPKQKQQVNNSVEYYSDHKQCIDGYVYEKLNEEDIETCIDTFHMLNKMISEIEVIPLEEYISYTVVYEDTDRLGTEIYKIMGLLFEAWYDHTTVYDRNNNSNLYSTDSGMLFAEQWAIKNGYNIRTSITIKEEHAVIEIDEEGKSVETIKEFADFLKNEDSDLCMLDSGIEIEENFKRPKLKIDNMTAKSARISLNMNKPLNELIAYITHIKQDMDKDRQLLKAPIELVGEELQRADDISRMCTETKNGKTICFDGREGVTRTQKLADMFFIYDMIKQGKKPLRIRTEISEYYLAAGKETEMSEATFRKYRDIAIDYIDNERYTELTTGVKQKR